MPCEKRIAKKKTMLNRIIQSAIAVYQKVLSPLKPPSCRFLPTCSDYAKEALRGHGVLKGLKLTIKRVIRCHPWGGSGCDPVPEAPAKDARS